MRRSFLHVTQMRGRLDVLFQAANLNIRRLHEIRPFITYARSNIDIFSKFARSLIFRQPSCSKRVGLFLKFSSISSKANGRNEVEVEEETELDKDATRLRSVADQISKTKDTLESQGKTISRSDFNSAVEHDPTLISPAAIDAILKEMMDEITINGGADIDFCIELLESVQSICKSFGQLSPSSQGFVIRAVSIALYGASTDTFLERAKIVELINWLIRINATAENISTDLAHMLHSDGTFLNNSNIRSDSLKISLFDLIFEKTALVHDPLLEPECMVIINRFGINISRKSVLSPRSVDAFGSLVAKKSSSLSSSSISQLTSFLSSLGIIGYSFSDLPTPLKIAIDKHIDLRAFSLDGGDQLSKLLISLGRLKISEADCLRLETCLQLLSVRGAMALTDKAVAFPFEGNTGQGNNNNSSSSSSSSNLTPAALVAKTARYLSFHDDRK